MTTLCSMERDGLVIAAGVLGILRGGVGVISGLPALQLATGLDRLLPGAAPLIYFEVLTSVVVLTVSIWALVKANDPHAGQLIVNWGWIFVVAGLIDWIAGASVMKGQDGGAAFGGFLGLALVGGFLIAGGDRLRKRA